MLSLLATWLELARDESGRSVPAHVKRKFYRYLECGILAHCFARARCVGCGHDFLVAFSCKGRGVGPFCNTRRMVETAAHLADVVFDGVFAADTEAGQLPQFHETPALDAQQLADIHRNIRRRLLRALTRRRVLKAKVAEEMAAGDYDGGFSLAAGRTPGQAPQGFAYPKSLRVIVAGRASRVRFASLRPPLTRHRPPLLGTWLPTQISKKALKNILAFVFPPYRKGITFGACSLCRPWLTAFSRLKTTSSVCEIYPVLRQFSSVETR